MYHLFFYGIACSSKPYYLDIDNRSDSDCYDNRKDFKAILLVMTTDMILIVMTTEVILVVMATEVILVAITTEGILIVMTTEQK